MINGFSRLRGLIAALFRRDEQAQAGQAPIQLADGEWPTTTGVVIESTTQVRKVARSSSIIPVVAYHYLVDGHMYLGSGIRSADQAGKLELSADAEATLARYPVGTNVTVHYNPTNPAEAVLER